ncbi:MAG: hypothetical protein GQ531_07485 [Sulfurovum sp.]|nr:hypothetical protein [Sulfurovum sp.]
MNTFHIKEPILEGYKNTKLTEERMDLLTTQVNEQLDEISQNKEIYDAFLKKVNAPEKIDKIILWILLMSNEDVVEEYISEFGKNFREIIPVGDLADLLLYTVYLKKVENIELEGIDCLLEYKEGLDEVDQFAFTNALLYVQKSKEVQIEF